MATLAEHEASMTIYYYKSDGAIYSYGTGINDMTRFGDRQKDYELILDCVVLPKDPVVMEFLQRFYIDIETKELKLKPDNDEFTKYL